MTPSPVALLFSLVLLAAIAVIVAGVAFVLFVREDEAMANACRNPVTGEERLVEHSPDQARLFQESWDRIEFELTRGAGAESVTLPFSESTVSSRAGAYLGALDAPIEDLVICFHEGRAEARGNMKVPTAGDLPLIGGLFETTVRIEGTLDVSGEYPRLVVTELDAGSLPGFVEDELRDEAEREINKRLVGLDSPFDYDLTFLEGQANVTGRLPAAAP